MGTSPAAIDARAQALDGDTALSLRARLRRATAAEHRELERLLPLVEPPPSATRYRRVLQTLYGFYARLEPRLSRLTPLVPMSGLPLRMRARLLAGDLVALGMPRAQLAQLPHCDELPATACAEHLAGRLYVLEGASLGGQLIARTLALSAGSGTARATAFFEGDGAPTGRRWRRVLDGWSPRRGEILSAARQTFERLGRWVQRQDTGQ